MELRSRCGAEDDGPERYGRDTDMRWGSCRMGCYAKQTMRFSPWIAGVGNGVRVYGFRAGEYEQDQDDERRGYPAQL